VLRRFGADPDAVPEDEAAARVSASAVRERIVSALDRLVVELNLVAARGVLRRVDADPFRDELRDALLARNRAKVVGLAQRKAALEQPPGFAAFLSAFPAITMERRQQLLEAAVSRRSGDLGLLMTLGNFCYERRGGLDEQLRWYQAAVAAAPANAAAHNNLGRVLGNKGQFDEAIACLRKAIELDPKFAGAHLNLSAVLHGKGQLDAAITSCRKAIQLDPKYAAAHTNLGVALADRGKVEEAIVCFRKAIALDPKHAAAHSNLGKALGGKGQVDEAITSFRKAIELDPMYTMAHFNLGNALRDKGQVEKAIACFRKAIALDPKDAKVHNNLGRVLKDKGKVEEAIACFRKAVALDPKLSLAHTNLGQALTDKGQVEEAIVCFRKVIELDPKNARAHYNLGNLLGLKDQPDSAIPCWRRSIELNPKFAPAHASLGIALHEKGQVEEAIACFKKAVALDPRDGTTLGALGQALLGKGRYAEAKTVSARALVLLPQSHPLRPVVAGQVQDCKRFLKLEGRLPGVLRGEDKARSAQEGLEFAQMCHHKRMYADAARLYADAFTADPKRADDLKAQHRYCAACSAALAAVGQGEDAARLDDKERVRLWKQALDWLRADLALYRKQLTSGRPGQADQARAALAHWQKDSDLASLRDKVALAKLPAEERAACEKLWTDVAAVLKKAETEAKKDSK
jgi:tetratricopeptide (TPR) repeat protein